jgi:short-subunit dehydrogenase
MPAPTSEPTASGARSALVTGGSAGIGLAIARMLAAEGYALTLVARRPEPLERAAEELAATGTRVDVLAGDLLDEEVVRAAAEGHRARHGALDVLVNNAGVGIGQRVGELRTRSVDVQLGLDLRTPILLHRETLDLLTAAAAARGKATVVNVASMAGRTPHEWLSVYSAAKAGLIAFNHAMNRELADHAIHCTALVLGTVDTGLTDHLRVDRDRLIGVDDVAVAVRMLLQLSPRCRVSELVLEPPRELTADELGGAA